MGRHLFTVGGMKVGYDHPTRPPWRASASAIAEPMAPAAPVTTKTLPGMPSMAALLVSTPSEPVAALLRGYLDDPPSLAFGCLGPTQLRFTEVAELFAVIGPAVHLHRHPDGE